MADSTKSRLILARHAHRDTSDRDADNGLSEKGRRQARELAAEVRAWMKREGIERAVLWSSPKLRCVETLEPLADALGVDVEVRVALDERRVSEDGRAFRGRVAAFRGALEAAWMADPGGVIVACSHGDWLPEFTREALGSEAHFGKAEWKPVRL